MLKYFLDTFFFYKGEMVLFKEVYYVCPNEGCMHKKKRRLSRFSFFVCFFFFF